MYICIICIYAQIYTRNTHTHTYTHTNTNTHTHTTWYSRETGRCSTSAFTVSTAKRQNFLLQKVLVCVRERERERESEESCLDQQLGAEHDFRTPHAVEVVTHGEIRCKIRMTDSGEKRYCMTDSGEKRGNQLWLAS